MEAIKYIDIVVGLLFCVCYAYQTFYVPVPWLFKRKAEKEVVKNRFAVMICGRNEAAVIGDLLDSIKAQTYDQKLVTAFVLADNCTDDTAQVAREHGAVVYERFNKELVGKSYALSELLEHIRQDYPEGFDGYFVFDADNLLSPDYIEKMNVTFSQGHDVVTSYRNSKNFGDNWVSAGNALWFLRESRYLNHARYLLGNSCAVSGTGYLFSRRIEEEVHDWPFHLMTEDVEFSAYNIIKGRKIAFCPEAEFFDEQPVKFSQSWRQRKRWAKGNFQVVGKYGGELFKGMLHGNFSCYDMLVSTVPAFVFSLVAILVNLAAIICAIVTKEGGREIFRLIAGFIPMIYGGMAFMGAITTLTEWKRINASAFKKILYTITFPLFMATYLPICIVALFSECTWKPIEHTKSVKAIAGAAARDRRREKRLGFFICFAAAAVFAGAMFISGYVSNVGAKRIVSEGQAAEMEDIDYIVIFAGETGDYETCMKLFRERVLKGCSLVTPGRQVKMIIFDERTENEKRKKKRSAYIEKVTESLDIDLKGIDYVVDECNGSTYDALLNLKTQYDTSHVIIVAQECRLSRALYIARGVGLEAYGVACDADDKSIDEAYREVSEAFARIRDFTYVVLDGIVTPEAQSKKKSEPLINLKKGESL